MAILEIVKYPDPRLLQLSKPVHDPAEVFALVENMAETMYALSGAGLAAIQVGEPLRLFIIDAAIAEGSEEDPPMVFINPEVVELGAEKESVDEGCLSFPGVYVPIARALHAKVRATDLQGQVFECEGTGLLARALQHESDHLDGKLLTNYVGRIKRQLIQRKMAKEAADPA